MQTLSQDARHEDSRVLDPTAGGCVEHPTISRDVWFKQPFEENPSADASRSTGTSLISTAEPHLFSMDRPREFRECMVCVGLCP